MLAATNPAAALGEALVITGHDHYVNIPMSKRQGDFRKPERILVYSARTQGDRGEAVKGADRVFAATPEIRNVHTPNSMNAAPQV